MGVENLSNTLNTSDIIALGSAIVAVFALVASIQTAIITRRVETTGFKISEGVRDDTARLIATFRSLMLKGMLYTQQDFDKRDDPKSEAYIDVRSEKSEIQRFMLSPTALAYHLHAAQASAKSKSKDDAETRWRTFFLELVGMLNQRNPYLLATTAARMEAMIEPLTKGDLEQMADSLKDIGRALGVMMKAREHDTAIEALMQSAKEKEATEELTHEFILFLERKGIDDPDVKLFSAVFGNDVPAAEAALKSGAKINVTTGEIRRRYQTDFDDFKKIKNTNNKS
jgi:hypothetical protein